MRRLRDLLLALAIGGALGFALADFMTPDPEPPARFVPLVKTT